jgi:hypothetical protein
MPAPMEKATNVSAGLELIFISEKLTAVIFDTALELFCRGIILQVSLPIDGCMAKKIYQLVYLSSISAESALDLSREMLRPYAVFVRRELAIRLAGYYLSEKHAVIFKTLTD